MFLISQVINYRHLNCLYQHCHPLITKTSVLYARMTTALYSYIVNCFCVEANFGVDLLVIVYEIRNDTVFNHSFYYKQ